MNKISFFRKFSIPLMELKYITKLFLILPLVLILHLNTLAEIRYVSKTGSSTPPYLSWSTAADSIQKCVNICQFGDTVYVANGVYKEQVIMIPGLSLIGAGADSCVIDTRDMAVSWESTSVMIADSCLLVGFYIKIAPNNEIGTGIAGSGKSSVITLNRISSGRYGTRVDSNHIIIRNSFDSVTTGIYFWNSSSIAKQNYISPAYYNDIGTSVGIDLNAYYLFYVPVIDSNYILVDRGYAIDKAVGNRPVITNNIIIIPPPFGGWGFNASYSDSGKIFNNLIYATLGEGIYTTIENLQIYNNYIATFQGEGIRAWRNNVIKNNVITGASIGIVGSNQFPLTVKYNNFWRNQTNYSGFTADSTNISVDPMVINDDSTMGELDFHLQKYSPLIDAGDPSILDKDSTRSDIGLYGGPFGEIYSYYDRAPRAPVNLNASVDSLGINLSWNNNTEADFAFYRVYRDSTAGFQIDSTKLISEQQDTFFVDIPPPGAEKLYYKLTAVDSQQNESLPSEEISVNLNAVAGEPAVSSDYVLYQNYPNPFNPTTRISYKLKESGYVKLYIYDVKGELIDVLENGYQQAGYYEKVFSAPGTLASGFYIYKIIVMGDNNIPVFSDIKKMLFIK